MPAPAPLQLRLRAQPRPRAAAPTGQTQRGFTLLELMVVMALSALVLGLVAPAMDQFVARQRLRSASYDLMSDLTLARSESLKRVGGVQLLPASGSDWRSGWRLTDANGDLLVQRNPMGGSLQVLTAPTAVSFDARGMVSADSPVKFGLSDGRGSQRCIVLDPSGRPKSLSMACSP